MRILMIEDDKELAEITKLRLEKDNFTVDVCLDGAEGLYYMQENMYDLVILDRMLPSMDGTQVLKEARKANVSTPVIFLTALGELEDKITGLDCGADDYMVKPFAFEELLARKVKEGVEVYLDRSLERFETVLPAAGSSNSCIELTLPELEKFSAAKGWVDVCKLPQA